MLAISTPQVKFFLELPVTTPAEKKILEERTISYNAFLNTFRNLEKQTKEKIEELKEYPKQKTQEQQDSLEKSLVEQNELLTRLQNEDEKKVFNFILKNHKNIFKADQKKIKELNKLNEENFSRLLVLVYKKIRAKSLADEEHLTSGEIKTVVDNCVTEIRWKEATDWAVGCIKNNMPGVSLLRKMPGFEKILGKEEEEKEKKQLSDEQMVTQFLWKSLWPIITLIIVISLGGLSGPMSVFGLFTIPYFIVIGVAVFGLVAAEYKAVKGLFLNDEGRTSDNHVQSSTVHDIGTDIPEKAKQEQNQKKQKTDEEQAKKLDEILSKDISDIILNTPVKEIEQSKDGHTLKKVTVSQLEATKTNQTNFLQNLQGERRESSNGIGVRS